MKSPTPLGFVAVVIVLAGCSGGDEPPVVGKDAPGTEAVSKAMDSPEMQAKLAARNAARGTAGRDRLPDRSR